MIEVEQLSKHFGPKRAVDDVSFTVEKGEILGFLGPNGAGKSTTMRMITGFIPPTAGRVRIGGADVGDAPLAARKQIGYLPENAPVYPDMTVNGYLEFCAEVRGFSGSERQRRVAATIEKCFLERVTHQTVSTLSKGYKQRVCFAQSILHDPAYLILDEPTDGLDPNQKHEVRQMIKTMAADKAIIFSTHILDEVDAVCTRAIIIAEGKIVADDTPTGLRSRSPLAGALTLTLGATEAEAAAERFQQVAGVQSVNIVSNSDEAVQLRIFPADRGAIAVDSLLAEAAARQLTVKAITTEQGRLDEVFRAITTIS
ncbi:MAG: ATP-binding cassette domain-containing protein [Desulfosarcinaceae bacterium]|nr:ATP-binding cassette domain-containing protein [Desulfosarcinaceae bacterium]